MNEDESAIRWHLEHCMSLAEEEFDAENMNLPKVLMPKRSTTGLGVKTESNGPIKMLFGSVLFDGWRSNLMSRISRISH
jgi:hypothetical protein